MNEVTKHSHCENARAIRQCAAWTNLSENETKHPGHFVGVSMHSDLREDLAGTVAFPASPRSIVSPRFGLYREKAFFEAWPPYTGVRP